MLISFAADLRQSRIFLNSKWVKIEHFFLNKSSLSLSLEFCPAECDGEKEMMCPGKWNEDWTEQMSGDYCIPNKNGDCVNHCPMDCGKDMLCPGKMDPKGCKMPDTCVPGSKLIFNHDLHMTLWFQNSMPKLDLFGTLTLLNHNYSYFSMLI